MTKARMVATIRGRVQGVGFRWFVRREAHSMGLSGWVRNEPDGTVTVEAEGARDDLDTLAERLRKGPPGSRVEAADVRWSDMTGRYDEFTIR